MKRYLLFGGILALAALLLWAAIGSLAVSPTALANERTLADASPNARSAPAV